MLPGRLYPPCGRGGETGGLKGSGEKREEGGEPEALRGRLAGGSSLKPDGESMGSGEDDDGERLALGGDGGADCLLKNALMPSFLSSSGAMKLAWEFPTLPTSGGTR